MENLTERQLREIEYHRERAGVLSGKALKAVATDIVLNKSRRWWNGYWAFWTQVRAVDWEGKRVLVPGAGYGDDAVRLACLGATVVASDISPDSVEIARSRAALHGLDNITFEVAPLETLPYDDDSFDGVLLVDIMHHVNVEAAVREIARVLKPGAYVFVNEIYTHDFIERTIRQSGVVKRWLYPLLTRTVYGTGSPYITQDERKLNAAELATIASLTERPRFTWFNMTVGRLFSVSSGAAARIDRAAIALLGPLGRFVAGRVLISGKTSE